LGIGGGRGEFEHNLGGVLVLAHAEEGGLAGLLVGGPGGETDLGDEGGLDPEGSATGFGEDLVEGGGSRRQGFELLANGPAGFLGESGSGSACADELVAVVVAEDEGADSAGAVGWEGVAADDELLLVEAFGL
jgi:hypothetical protein